MSISPNVPSLALTGRDPDESAIVGPLCRTIDVFARDLIDSGRIDREHAIPPHVLDGARSLGLFGLPIPEEYGGAGLSLQGVCTAIAALARHDRSVATTVGLHTGLGTRGLVAFGSSELQSQWLPVLASGERIAAFATTEAMAGSDLSAIRTKAVSDGDDLRVDGGKVYVTNGNLAGLYTITASTPGLGGARRGHSLLLLEAGQPGLTVGPEESKLGLRGSSTTPLFLEDVRLPHARVIGEVGQGMAHLQHVLAWGRTVMASGCTGASTAALQATLRHVTTRKQFGRAIGSFDVVRRQVADMAALHFMAVALVRHTCAVAEEPEELLMRSLAAKVICSDANWEICDTAVQLHGGAGFIEDTGLPLLLRDSRIMRIFEGANDVLTVHAGSVEMKAHRQRRSFEGRVGGLAEPLALRADRLDHMLAALRDELLAEHGVRLFGMQTLLHRLGRLAVLCEASDAAVLRAEAEGDARSAALAAHWLHMAEERMGPALRPGPSTAHVSALTAELYEEVQ
ncbi:MAG: hypothetical protein AMXMBFR64_38550 [Myxococcales bacterium]